MGLVVVASLDVRSDVVGEEVFGGVVAWDLHDDTAVLPEFFGMV